VPLKTLHPAVSKVTAAALTPIQKLYEHAWFKTVNNVQTEVGRIHSELTAAADTERGRRMQAEVVVEEMRRENGVLRQECAALRARLGKVARERERDGMGVGREVEEMRREVEEKERELREERASRLSAEHKLLDAMDKLRAVGGFSFVNLSTYLYVAIVIR
jgi:predicted RNase H-like nuclease (RuvC/YqgF family)